LLLDRGAKLLVIACNTATSIGEEATRAVAAERGVEVVPVVEPQSEIAAAITDNGRVGVLATPNTVESGAYRARRGRGPGARGDEVEAPDLASFIQDGSPSTGRCRDGALLLRAAEAGRGRHPDPRLHPLPAGGADAAADPRPRRAPVSGGHAVAAAVQRCLERRGLARAPTAKADYRFLCTGDVESFHELGTRFLQMPLARSSGSIWLPTTLKRDECARTSAGRRSHRDESGRAERARRCG